MASSTDSLDNRLDGPVDLRTLAAQTGGDRRLEREVLSLFLAKAESDFARIAAARTVGERRQAAHSLIGSAGAIGAVDVTARARAVERAQEHDPHAIAALGEALATAATFIGNYLRG
jgi:HPt (histidine-containing phosphotransfer) domain-containing protein